MTDKKCPNAGRKPKSNPDKIGPKEEKFARLYASGLTKTEAAKEAGYEYPAEEGNRLLRRRVVADRVLSYMRPYMVSWKKLLLKAQKVLDNHLDDANEYAKELIDHMRDGGAIDARAYKEFLKMLNVSAADRNTAARLVIESMSKINPKSLSDAAGSEDAAMTRDEAVEAMLGADAEGEPVSDAAPDDEADGGDAPEPEVTH